MQVINLERKVLRLLYFLFRCHLLLCDHMRKRDRTACQMNRDVMFFMSRININVRHTHVPSLCRNVHLLWSSPIKRGDKILLHCDAIRVYHGTSDAHVRTIVSDFHDHRPRGQKHFYEKN